MSRAERREGAASPLHRDSPHESAARHVTGEAIYVDDVPLARGELVGLPLLSPSASGIIDRLDVSAAAREPGVVVVLTAADVPGRNDVGPVVHDEPLFATGTVEYKGQIVALVVGTSIGACRRALAKVDLAITPRPPVLGIAAAIGAGSFLGEPMVFRKGDVEAALAAAPRRLEGELSSGGQDHFYLETHAARAEPGEGGTIRVSSSTQHPSEVQAIIAHLLGCGRSEVVVESPRMGGGFGGKETQANYAAGLAAIAARATGRPVRVRFDRETDMTATGKRHPWFSRFRAGFDDDGRLLALAVDTFADAGWSTDLSRAILQRCLFHIDHAYYLPAARFTGRLCRTNSASNTAFRGFGGPQGALVAEEVMNRIAETLGRDPAEVRRRNFYGAAPRDVTPWGQEVVDPRLERIAERLLGSSGYAARREEIAAANARSPWVKRGIAFGPVKFGISFTTSFLNQAGALVLVYADGTVQVNHGGTEMGQGLHTKIRAIAAHELGIGVDRVRVMPTSTDKVPNTSATAASSGTDLNGAAVALACRELAGRLRGVAAQLLRLDPSDAARIVLAGGRAGLPGGGDAIPFEQLASEAHLRQVPLSATGHYSTPGIHFDARQGTGRPFHYFAFGGAVTEVEVSGLTGESRIRRVDILHDAGASLVPSIDRGQVEGGFVQGAGWLTMEELVVDRDGALRTVGPSTYKIPAAGDAPIDFRVELLADAAQPGVIHGSKAVGEPPFLLAISVLGALRHAIGAFAPAGRGNLPVELAVPATPEAILRSIEAVRGPARLVP